MAEPRGPCTSRCRARCWPQRLAELDDRVAGRAGRSGAAGSRSRADRGGGRAPRRAAAPADRRPARWAGIRRRCRRSWRSRTRAAIAVARVEPHARELPGRSSAARRLRLRAPDPRSTRPTSILVVDCDVPWFPARVQPARRRADRPARPSIRSSPAIRCGRFPVRRADRGRARGRAAAARRGGPPACRAAGRRRAGRALGGRRSAGRGQPGRRGEAERGRTPIGFPWASRCVRELARRRHDRGQRVPARPPPRPAAGRRELLRLARTSGGLGWGLGAALGVKLAAPEKTVIATVGDGAYIFGAPTAAHFAARLHDAAGPDRALQQQRLGRREAATRSASTRDGWAATTGHFPLTDLSPAAALRGDRPRLRRPRRARRGPGGAAGRAPPRPPRRPRRAPPGRRERRLPPPAGLAHGVIVPSARIRPS